jgi:hypothetical protein
VAGPAFSSPARRKIPAGDEAESWILPGKPAYEVRRPIRGMVVEDQDLQVWIVTGEQGFQAGLDPLFLVPGGN